MPVTKVTLKKELTTREPVHLRRTVPTQEDLKLS
ncbi:hypothetical protein F4694_000324 [Bacillus niacini]|jgi:hypothetical protein|uniref:Uncharacterized protein n=1 Tax=Neobacillus niacini TaxID=86668 RepID=A0A852T6W8_9BACI|nr:hypothetical protein [Neobacillus niacini]